MYLYKRLHSFGQVAQSIDQLVEIRTDYTPFMTNVQMGQVYNYQGAYQITTPRGPLPVKPSPIYPNGQEALKAGLGNIYFDQGSGKYAVTGPFGPQLIHNPPLPPPAPTPTASPVSAPTSAPPPVVSSTANISPTPQVASTPPATASTSPILTEEEIFIAPTESSFSNRDMIWMVGGAALIAVMLGILLLRLL